MTSEHLRPWDADLRQHLHQRAGRIVVDVEAGLRAVEGGTRQRRRRRTRRSWSAALATSAAVLALVLGGRALLVQPGEAHVTGDGPPIALSDGTYRYQLTAQDLRTASGGQISAKDIRNNVGTWTWDLHDGRWSLDLNPTSPAAEPSSRCAGRVTVDGDLATFVRTVNGNPVGECAPRTWSARYLVQGGVVSWSDVSVPGFGWFFAGKPWIRP
jgi:hypothetical protein